ncbi:MAG: glycosyltransferase family protein [Brevinema sp.]
MANILISFFSYPVYTEFNNDKTLVFYDGFIQSLQNQGNNVLVYNAGFFDEKQKQYSMKGINKTRLKEKISQFNPDLIISFNHILPPNVEAYTQCPILLWAADNFWYWRDFEIAQKKDYPIITNSIGLYQDFKEQGFSHLFNLPLATAVCAEKCEQTHNISFIGTLFYQTKIIDIIKQYPEFRPEARQVVVDFCHVNEYEKDVILKKCSVEFQECMKDDAIFYELIDLRLTTVAALLEYGIEIFGVEDWQYISRYFWSFLNISYSSQKVYTLKQNQDTYNASKLALSINHPQAKMDGFSWRVYDILASNACLLAQKNTGVHALLKPYIDLPMFESPSDAAALAKKLLANPSQRQEIVEASQLFIKEHGRWENNITQISEITGISLKNEGTGSVNYLLVDEYMTGFLKLRIALAKCIPPIKGRYTITKMISQLGLLGESRIQKIRYNWGRAAIDTVRKNG